MVAALAAAATGLAMGSVTDQLSCDRHGLRTKPVTTIGLLHYASRDFAVRNVIAIFSL